MLETVKVFDAQGSLYEVSTYILKQGLVAGSNDQAAKSSAKKLLGMHLSTYKGSILLRERSIENYSKFR